MAVYVGRNDELTARLRELEPAVERVREVGNDLDRTVIHPAVREAEPELGGALAADDHPLEALGKRLEVDVPDPGHVAPVGDAVVQRDHGHRRSARFEQRPHGLVRPGRVLDQEHEQRLVRRSRSARTGRTRRERVSSPAAISSSDAPSARASAAAPARCRRCRGPARASAHAACPSAHRARTTCRDPVRARRRAPATSSRGRRMAARRAAVVAEMSDVHGGVLIRCSAADAVLRIRRVLERGPRLAGIVDAEGHARGPCHGRARRRADRRR